ncbi:MAG TPA: ATP-binding protein [Anaerolineaceae bacterium]|nr:ATP-binding protein [Anaerolineaceae bacterium]
MTSPSKEQLLVVISDFQIKFLLERVLMSAGYQVTLCQDRASAQKILRTTVPALIIMSEKLDDSNGLEFANELSKRLPGVPIILFVEHDSPDLLKRAMRAGINEYLCLPLRSEDILKATQNTLERAQQRREWVLLEARRATSNLQRQVNELETLARLGRSITASLDLDSVLSAIVDAAVELTGADEGSLLLLDETTGELYMRAGRNFQEEFVRTFRLPITDTLAGSVLRSGQPVLLDEKTPQKIKTAYLVHSLVYVPIQIHGHVFGVLGIDNRTERAPFKDRDVKLLSAIAEFAVIAIENARLYTNTITERNKLETVLTRIQDGVIVVDSDQRMVMVNQAAQSAFNLPAQPVIGRQFKDVFSQPELLELIDSANKSLSNRVEISVEDGRVFNAQLTPIPDVGIAITMHDITYLKKLDRIKSDFVSTVSHDLRSPLTAIMGYVELIERAGPINDLQRDFVRRVQVSVQNITTLVDDLLNLGRIEAGFDARKESINLGQLIYYSAEGFKKQLTDNGHHLQLELPNTFPPIFANPVQFRQMIDNLLDNAIKYTAPGGTITIHGTVEQNQIILQFIDSGIGIPALDLPYIFDKFYRASNVNSDVTGTGLGLAIVKSIVESHDGRIWVDSTLGQGTTFTVVLPLSEQ